MPAGYFPAPERLQEKAGAGSDKASLFFTRLVATDRHPPASDQVTGVDKLNEGVRSWRRPSGRSCPRRLQAGRLEFERRG